MDVINNIPNNTFVQIGVMYTPMHACIHIAHIIEKIIIDDSSSCDIDIFLVKQINFLFIHICRL